MVAIDRYRKGDPRHVRNLFDELESWQGWPEAWRPQPGDILVGFIDGYDVGYTSYGEVRTVIVTREETNQKVSVWLSSTVLLNLFQKHKPRPGERIGLKYLGKDREKGYHRYRLVVDRPEPLELTPLGGEEVESEHGEVDIAF
jgi:hypothetical protein